MPSNSDLIKWAEQGRLHTKYTQVGTAAALGDPSATFQVNDPLNGPTGAVATGSYDNIAIREGQTVFIDQNDGSGSNKAIVTSVDINVSQIQFTVAFYEATGLVTAGTGVGASDVTVFIYGSEFRKGTNGMEGS